MSQTRVTPEAPAKGTRKRAKFIRNKGRVDEIVTKAMDRLRKERGDVFKVGVQTIIDAMDGRTTKPSRASVYRAVERLAAEGKVQIARKGERGNYTYNFGTPIPSGSVTAQATPVPASASPTAMPAVSSEVSILIERSKTLDAQLDALLAQLRADVATKEQTLQAVQSSLSHKEPVAA